MIEWYYILLGIFFFFLICMSALSVYHIIAVPLKAGEGDETSVPEL